MPIIRSILRWKLEIYDLADLLAETDRCAVNKVAKVLDFGRFFSEWVL